MIEHQSIEDIQLVLMLTVVDRGYGEKIKSLIVEEGVFVNFLILGYGTADSEILDYLGLGEVEKDLVFSTMPIQRSKYIFEKLRKSVKLKKPGRGISFTIPISSVCGKTTVKNLKGLHCEEEGELMEQQEYQYDLIIAIGNRGYSDMIMDAAKAAGAGGGTVIHARGTGMKEAEKFFGITIQPEKVMVFIVAEKEMKSAIMKSIGQNAGIKTEARAVVFSMPINGVEGISDVKEIKERIENERTGN